VVKETPVRSSHKLARMADGFRFETALADAGVPLPRPRPLRDGTGGVWVRATAAGERVAVTVREYVAGEPAGYLEPLDVCVPTALAVATALGQAHQITWRPRVPRDADSWAGPERWAALRDRTMRLSPDVAPILDALAPMLEFAESILRIPRPVRLLAPVHSDANPHNVLRTGTGICLLDWGEGALRDPQTELASALLVWGCDQHGLPRDGLPARMVRAYRATGAAFEPTDLTVFQAHLRAMVDWAFALCRIAIGDQPRPPQWAIAQLHESVLAWEPRWHRLPQLLEHVQAA